MTLSRRRLIQGLAATPLLAPAIPSIAGSNSLRDIAAARGLIFGAEAMYKELQEPPLAQLYIQHCGMLTPGNEAKWWNTEPEDGKFEFAQLDWMVDFATDHGMAVHLHNLAWAIFNPPWVEPAVTRGRAAEIMQRHIDTVVRRYRGRADSWDVLNEPSDPRWHLGPEGLTFNLWRTGLGGGYPALAFGWAHEADPLAKLFVNDDGLEYDTPLAEQKRQIYLRLIDDWQRAGVPIDGFGLESHIQPDQPFDAARYRRFLGELAQRGLTLYLTEIDVIDKSLPADQSLRDRAIADATARLLDAALDEKAVKAVITWGLSSRYSWLNEAPEMRRADGLRSRGMPFDDDLRPTLMFGAIAKCLASAPAR